MFDQILVPVDGSPTSLRAIDKAIALAKAFKSKVSVISFVDPYPLMGMNAEIPYGQEDFRKAAKAEAEKAIHVACEQLTSAGVEAHGEVVESHTVWRGILESAGKAHADLVVMGSHGRHGLEKLVLGSVTQRVLQHASLPVMVVRGE